MKIQSYINGHWYHSEDQGVAVKSAIDSKLIGTVSSRGIDFKEVVSYGRRTNASLRKMSFHERASSLKTLGLELMAKKELFYQVSALTGATRADSWIDIEGGIGTLLSLSSIVRREFPNQPFFVEGGVERLSAEGSFIGRHILTPKRGVAVHINAYNFPCWGMLEKIAPSLLAGVPVIVKPATPSCYLTEAMVKQIIATDILPEGALQLICGSVGDLLEHLDEQDIVTFTGSATTGQMLKSHPNIMANNIPFTLEADSLNCIILGEGVKPDSDEFNLFIKEIAREITVKAGQKCTAIRRAIVPEAILEAAAEALKKRLSKVKVGNPNNETVHMGALAGQAQRQEVIEKVKQLQSSCQLLCGGSEAALDLVDANAEEGSFYAPTLLLCERPLQTEEPHTIEAFGPVSTLMPYQGIDNAIEIAHLGRGSLVSSIVTADEEEAAYTALNIASSHGRLLVLSTDCAKESTGHGSPLAQLIHGGPGRAGGGEELGGGRAVKQYLQRTAVQGSPTMLTAITREYNRGSRQLSDGIHPFRKTFDELLIGETFNSHRRTVTEADIVNFGCLSGDHFYAHFDETAAATSLFGKRVAHGYFLISAAAGMFVDPAPGPVLANYGLESLRFIEPVGIGDTIKVRLTVKTKNKKDRRPEETRTTGVVVWEAEITNQQEQTVASYDILTLVEREDT